MRFRVLDGACDALLPGAVGTLAGHPGGIGSRYTCGCGHPDCPHPTPKPPPPPEKPEGADGDDDAAAAEAPDPEPPRIGHLWLDFAEDQLTEAKRAERGTLPAPEHEPETCATCHGSCVVHLEAQRSEHRLVVDVPDLPAGATELTIPHGMAPDADLPEFYAPPAEPVDFSQPVVVPGGPRVADDDTAEFEVESGADYADDYEPEPLVPELIEVQCPVCKGTGVQPPPPPPLIPPPPPLPFRAGIRADQVECIDAVGGYGA